MAKVSVVMATEGDDSDHDYWVVAAYSDKELADEHASRAKAWLREAANKAKKDLQADSDKILWYRSPYDITNISDDSLFKYGREYSVIEVELRDSLPENQNPEPLF